MPDRQPDLQRASLALDQLENGLSALEGLRDLIGDARQDALAMLLSVVCDRCQQSFEELHKALRKRG